MARPNRPTAAMARALPPVATPFCVALVILKTDVLVSRAAAGPNTACNRASYHKSSTGGRQQPEAGPDDQGRAKPAPGGPPASARTRPVAGRRPAECGRWWCRTARPRPPRPGRVLDVIASAEAGTGACGPGPVLGPAARHALRSLWTD